MAKKEKLSTGKFDLDSELDFDSFDVSEIDAGINPEVKKGGKSRKVVTDVFKGTISGAKDQFKDPAFLAKVTKDSLPSSYGDIFNAADQVSSSASKLYDEAVRELKPQLGQLSKKLDRLVPDERKTLKRMTGKFKSMFDEHAYTGPTRDQIMDQGVTNALGQIFGAQQEANQQQQARINVEERVKSHVETKRFESNFGLLSSINESGQRLTAYTEKVTQGFQKKSLELQYRSYFVQNEMLQLTSKFYEVFKNQNEAIAKNTAMPDYVKITNTERLLQTGKEKFSERANDFFMGPESAIGRGMKKIGDQAKEYIGGIKQGIEAVLMGVDAAESMAGAAGDMNMSKSTMAGNFLGAKGADKIGGWISKKIKGVIEKHEKAKGIRDVGNKGANIAVNLPGAIGKLQGTKAYQDLLNKGGVTGGAMGFFDWLAGNFKDEKPNMTIKNPNSMNSLALGAKFDNRVYRSVTDIIPGYLSRILREITVLRTGDESTVNQIYDFTKGKFADAKKINDSMNTSFSTKAKTSIQGFRLNQLTNTVVGGQKLDEKTDKLISTFYKEVQSDTSVEQNTKGILASKQFKKLLKKDKNTAAIISQQLNGEQDKVSGKSEREIKKFFLEISKIPNFDYTPENLMATEEYEGLKSRDPMAAKILKKYFDEQVTGSDNKTGAQLDLTKSLSSVRSSTADIRYQIQQYIDAGYADILEENGVITTDTNGDYKIDEKKYHELIDKEILDPEVVDSDKNVKRNIRPTKSKSKMFGANKGGFGGLSPKKALDAIKGTKVYDWMYKLGQGTGKPNQTFTGPMAQDVNRTMGEEAAPGGTTIDLTTMNGNNMAAIQALSEKQDSMLGGEGDTLSILKDIKATTLEMLSIMQSGGGQTLGNMGDTFTKIGNSLPTTLKQLKDKAKTMSGNLFNKARDVYISGQESPAIKAALLRAGHYKDQATGKVIRSIEELKKIKGNVINANGEVILTMEDITKGLHDVRGKLIKTGSGLFDNARSRLGGLGGIASNLAGSALGKLGNLFPKYSNALGSIGGFLQGNKGFVGPMGPQPGDENFMGPVPEGRMDKLKGTVLERGKGLFGSLKHNARKASVLGKRKARQVARSEEATGAMQTGKSFLQSAKGLGMTGMGAAGNLLLGKKDAEGNRSGGWMDRLKSKEAEDKANDKGMLAADLTAKYRSEENSIDLMVRKAGEVMDLAKGGLSGIFGGAGDLMGSVGDLAGGLFGGGKKKGAAGKVGTLGRIGSMVAAPFKLGGKVIGGVAKGAVTAGKFAAKNPGAVFRGARTASIAASLMTGGVGSAIFGAVGVGLSAIGGILASPVILGTLAAAAVGYGAYRLYKHQTRNNVNDLETIRMLQYGLTAQDSQYNSAILTLEGYLCDSKIGFDNGKAYILEKKVDNKELISMFSIDENDEEGCAKFATWYKDRFKPFFLTHLTALFATDKKIALQDVDSLKPQEKLNYLGLIGFDGGPYTQLTSPFKNLASLTDTKEAALALIKKLSDMLTAKQKDKSKGTTPAAAAVVTAASVTAAAKPLPKAVTPPPTVAQSTAKPHETGGNPFTGEDGKETIVKKDSVRGGSGMPKLLVADGALRDGEGADQYMRLQPGVSLSGLNPAMLKNLRAMIQEYGERTGKVVTLTSGARSYEQQMALYRQNPAKAAKPGRSLHEFGLAVDADSDDIDAMEEQGLMRKYGFTRPVGGEPWHMESAGIQGNLDLAKRDPSFAEQAIESSLYKGGGGVGTMDGVEKYRRNTELAIAIANSSGGQKVNGDDKNVITAALKPSDVKAANAPDMNAPLGSIKGSSEQSATFGKYVSRSQTQVSAPVTLPDAETKVATDASTPTPTINTGNREEVKNAIMEVARKNGSDPNEAALIAAVESSLNPNAKAPNTSATGPFQFVNATWKEQMGKHGRKHGIDPNTSPNDITASTLLATEYLKSNRKAISSVKSNPNITDVYLAHFLGAGGARKFLKADPNAIAANILPDAAAKNPNIFYSNGKALTVAEVYNKIDAKLSKTAKDYGISIPTGNTMSAGVATAATVATTASSVVSPTTSSKAMNPSITQGGSTVNMPRGAFGGAAATVMNQPSGNTLPQRTASITNDFLGMTDTLTKQLDIQTQMRDLLKDIADKIGPERLKELSEKVEGIGQPAPAARGNMPRGGAQVVNSAIDLRRKAA